MTYCVSMVRDGKTGYLKYDGMDQDSIQSLLTSLGVTEITFITQDEFSTGVANLKETI